MTRLMNESVNYEAVYRTAPATPGLLKIHVTHDMCNFEIYASQIRLILVNLGLKQL